MSENPSKEVMEAPAQSTVKPESAPSNACMNSELAELADGKTHVALEVDLKTSGDESSVVVTDATGILNGAPICITGPVTIKWANLKAAFENDLPGDVKKHIDGQQKNSEGEGLEIGLRAFYYSAAPPSADSSEAPGDTKSQKAGSSTLLMNIELHTAKGLLHDLGVDEKIANIFDISGAAIRIVKIPPMTGKSDAAKKEEIDKLENYLKLVK